MKKKIAVVGAGIFGITVAIKLGKKYNIDLFEKEDDIFKCASGINQYRAHRGYHYPRSNTTVLSCLKGEQSFRKFYPKTMVDGTDHFYCISSNDSLINAKQYLKFCKKFKFEYNET